MTGRFRAGRIAAAAALVAVGASVVGVTTVGARSSGRPAHGTAYVAVTHQVGSTYIAAGNTTDSVLGTGAVTYTITAGTGTKPGTVKITATRVVVYGSTGSISGTASGVETTSASGAVTLTGKLNLTHGTGGQAGHSFIGTFTGTGKAALGPFVFHETGTYR
jgi:hypothetical protein